MSGAIGTIFSIFDKAMKSSMEDWNSKPSDPTYRIPQEILDYKDETKVASQSEMPGASVMRDRLEENLASSTGKMKEYLPPSAVMGGINEGYNKYIEGTRDIDIMDQQYRLAQEDKYHQAQQVIAEYKDKQWEYNENIPFQREMNEYYNKKKAMEQNMWGLGKAGLSAWLAAKNNKQQNDMLSKIYGMGSDYEEPNLYDDMGSIDEI